MSDFGPPHPWKWYSVAELAKLIKITPVPRVYGDTYVVKLRYMSRIYLLADQCNLPLLATD